LPGNSLIFSYARRIAKAGFGAFRNHGIQQFCLIVPGDSSWIGDALFLSTGNSSQQRFSSNPDHENR
jgi:hypothetical protein